MLRTLVLSLVIKKIIPTLDDVVRIIGFPIDEKHVTEREPTEEESYEVSKRLSLLVEFVSKKLV